MCKCVIVGDADTWRHLRWIGPAFVFFPFNCSSEIKPMMTNKAGRNKLAKEKKTKQKKLVTSSSKTAKIAALVCGTIFLRISYFFSLKLNIVICLRKKKEFCSLTLIWSNY